MDFLSKKKKKRVAVFFITGRRPDVRSRQFNFPSLLSPIRSVNNSPRYVAIILLHFFSFRSLFLFRAAELLAAVVRASEISFRRDNETHVARQPIG